ncbi:MAG: hypothetical protein NVSMB64_05820 [Candidatus Velthaea sp.]
MSAPARAQVYPVRTDPPRTLDRTTLLGQARDREIHERFTRGISAEERGEWKTAAFEFERIIALDPPEPKGSTARYDAAIAYARGGDYARATALLEEALKRDPGFLAAAANLVSVALLSGDTRAARAAADRFVALAPDSARARYARGLVALRDGDLATARLDFGVLAGNDPSYAAAHYDLALVEMRAERFDAAERELTRALELSPGYARARFALASVYVRAGRRSDARAAFDRAARDASDVTLRSLALELRDRL